jgi:hypothetical protein
MASISVSGVTSVPHSSELITVPAVETATNAFEEIKTRFHGVVKGWKAQGYDFLANAIVQDLMDDFGIRDAPQLDVLEAATRIGVAAFGVAWNAAQGNHESNPLTQAEKALEGQKAEDFYRNMQNIARGKADYGR